VKQSRALVVAVVLALIPLTRLTPLILNNAMYSVDSWPLLRLVTIVLKNPSVKLLELNTHHANWPLSTLFAATYIEIVDVDPYSFYSCVGIIVLSFALSCLVYALVSHSTSYIQKVLALLSLLLYTPFTIYTSAYLKEVYAYPIALTLLLTLITGFGRRYLLLAPLLIMALTLSHPLASLMVLSFTVTYIYLKLVLWSKLGVGNFRNVSILFTGFLLATIYPIYNILIVRPPVTFTLTDIAILIAFAAAVYGLFFLIYPSRVSSLSCALALVTVGVAGFMSIAIGFSIHYTVICHSLPLFTLAILLADPVSREALFSIAALLPIATLTLYTLTYASWLATIAHRFLNYFVIPVVLSLMLLAKKLRKGVFVVLLTLFLSSSLALYNAYSGRDFITFYWRFTEMDIALARLIEGSAGSKVIAGVKYAYMLGDAYVNSNTIALSKALQACAALNNVVLALNYDELVHGVPLSPLTYLKPLKNIVYCHSLVYSNLYNYLMV
jgi:hypothetical protein